MKIVALFIALLLERLFTHWFHWRELRWLDPLIDFGLRLSKRWSEKVPYLWLAVTLTVAVLPVLLARVIFHETLLGLPYLMLSVVVLFLCLGPQDIGEEVDRWRAAIESEDDVTERNFARALLERGFNDTKGARSSVPPAVFVQANNRMFAVIFWFVVLGPIGAWLYRMTDLVRRRALFQSQRAGSLLAAECGMHATQLQALLAWIPARLSAIGYILAGSYDAGRAAWVALPQANSLSKGNERLLGHVGVAALAAQINTDETPQEFIMRCGRGAKNLVLRTLWFWLVGLAVLTLVGFAI